MTIAVPLDHLAATLERFGSAVLVSLPQDTWPRVLTVDPFLDGDEIVVPSPHEICLPFIQKNHLVTLMWPPLQQHGYALIVDGWGTVSGGDVRIKPDHAVLHRPPSHSDGPVTPEEEAPAA
jgi:hypothetical protein